jgi:hypothetical protein
MLVTSRRDPSGFQRAEVLLEFLQLRSCDRSVSVSSSFPSRLNLSGSPRLRRSRIRHSSLALSPKEDEKGGKKMPRRALKLQMHNATLSSMIKVIPPPPWGSPVHESQVGLFLPGLRASVPPVVGPLS